MKFSKILSIVFFALAGTAVLACPKNTNAAFVPANFAFTYEGQKFPISRDETSAWAENSALPPSSNLIYRPSTLEQSLEELLNPGYSPKPLEKKYAFSLEKISNALKQLSPSINSTSTEPVLEISEGRATKFAPPKNGVRLNLPDSVFKTIADLSRGESSSEISASVTEPLNTLASTNALGINELVARGESTFAGSPKNRRFNIKIGVEKMSGIIVKPGEIFSFNKYLGPVDGEHGFLPELVIKKEGTVPEFGGGLCQVSSTTFRAAMAAGLPIKERRNHAYAVQYYAPQGTDATIYPGSVDLKFLNDTPGSLLIWPHLEGNNKLIFDFYGTKDNRVVTLSKPVQFDKKEDGSMKATWEREVIKDGVSKKDIFKSNYQSPALFHKTEEFAKATTTPTIVQ